ncbi:hypothetical protein [Peredibacter starrii]|uniref:Uncharacterized protein n=1 Tax=Peredibacter starrii TaxID=28202 RepID=A0AAX4HLN4_9BACT|nr:hypothetical protein [Peredibacter starrii]WPU64237.1 hypothetical protein SOO65_16205 [Peredibacter starrii]
MTSEAAGINWKKSTKIKLGIALVISNVFFFLLFGNNSEVKPESSGVPAGWVEIQLSAELFTPFHSGKKVLLVNRIGRKKLEGVLQTPATEGRMTVLVKETEAHALFQHETWEVLPFLKNLNFASVKKGESHEIRY